MPSLIRLKPEAQEPLLVTLSAEDLRLYRTRFQIHLRNFFKLFQNRMFPVTSSQARVGVMTVGGAVKRYASGEINTEEFMLEVGERGLNFASAGYGMAIGQTLIPIPVVGGAVGALVGSMLTSELIQGFVEELNRKDLEHRERQRLIAEYNVAVKQEDAFRAELENYLQNYFHEYRTCFDDALSQMHHAFLNSDADGMISAANTITRKLGGKVYFENRKEFDDFLADDSIGTIIL